MLNWNFGIADKGNCRRVAFNRTVLNWNCPTPFASRSAFIRLIVQCWIEIACHAGHDVYGFFRLIVQCWIEMVIMRKYAQPPISFNRTVLNWNLLIPLWLLLQEVRLIVQCWIEIQSPMWPSDRHWTFNRTVLNWNNSDRPILAIRPAFNRTVLNWNGTTVGCVWSTGNV